MPHEVSDDLEEGLNGEGEDEEDQEYMTMEGGMNWREPLMFGLALFHSITAFSMLIAYYCLKVPLVIFKREKDIARNLEFEGMWIAEQPGDDDIKGHWDKLVLSTASFPESYWDKFVKKKVFMLCIDLFDICRFSLFFMLIRNLLNLQH